MGDSEGGESETSDSEEDEAGAGVVNTVSGSGVIGGQGKADPQFGMGSLFAGDRVVGAGKGVDVKGSVRFDALSRCCTNPKLEVGRLGDYSFESIAGEKGNLNSVRAPVSSKLIQPRYSSINHVTQDDHGFYDCPSQKSSFDRRFLNCISLYVGNVPPSFSSLNLRTMFSRFGEVSDVFIPIKSSRTNASRFAFVRFKGKEDAARAIESMDGAVVEGFQLMVNEAKYARSGSSVQCKPMHDTYGSMLTPVSKLSAQFNQIQRNTGRAYYAQVVQAGGSGTRSLQKIRKEVTASYINSEWLGKSAVAILHKCYVFEEVRDLILSKFKVLKGVSFLGESSCLLSFESVDSYNMVLQDSVWHEWFLSIEPWKDESSRGVFRMWIQCIGIPISAWNLETFTSIAKLWGILVAVDEDTSSCSQLVKASLLIESNMRDIDECINLIVSGVTFKVSVMSFPVGSGLCSSRGIMDVERPKCGCSTSGKSISPVLDSVCEKCAKGAYVIQGGYEMVGRPYGVGDDVLQDVGDLVVPQLVKSRSWAYNSADIGGGAGPYAEDVGHFNAIFCRNSGISSIGEKGVSNHLINRLSVEELSGSGSEDFGTHEIQLGISSDPMEAELTSHDSAGVVNGECGSESSILMVDVGCGAGKGSYPKGAAVDQSSQGVISSSKHAVMGDSGTHGRSICSKIGVSSTNLHAAHDDSSETQLINVSSDGAIAMSPLATQSLRAPKGYHIINQANREAIINGLVDGVSEAFELGESVGIDISEEVKSLILAVMEKRQVFLKSLIDNG